MVNSKLHKTGQEFLDNLTPKLWIKLLKEHPEYYEDIPQEIVNSNADLADLIRVTTDSVQYSVNTLSDPETYAAQWSITPDGLKKIPKVRNAAEKSFLEGVINYPPNYEQVPQEFRNNPKFHKETILAAIDYIQGSPSAYLNYPSDLRNIPEVRDAAIKVWVKYLSKNPLNFNMCPEEFKNLAEIESSWNESLNKLITYWKERVREFPLDWKNVPVQLKNMSAMEIALRDGWMDWLKKQPNYIWDMPSVLAMDKNFLLSLKDIVGKDLLHEFLVNTHGKGVVISSSKPVKLIKKAQFKNVSIILWENFLDNDPASYEDVPKELLEDKDLKKKVEGIDRAVKDHIENINNQQEDRPSLDPNIIWQGIGSKIAKAPKLQEARKEMWFKWLKGWTPASILKPNIPEDIINLPGIKEIIINTWIKHIDKDPLAFELAPKFVAENQNAFNAASDAWRERVVKYPPKLEEVPVRFKDDAFIESIKQGWMEYIQKNPEIYGHLHPLILLEGRGEILEAATLKTIELINANARHYLSAHDEIKKDPRVKQAYKERYIKDVKQYPFIIIHSNIPTEFRNDKDMRQLELETWLYMVKHDPGIYSNSPKYVKNNPEFHNAAIKSWHDALTSAIAANTLSLYKCPKDLMQDPSIKALIDSLPEQIKAQAPYYKNAFNLCRMIKGGQVSPLNQPLNQITTQLWIKLLQKNPFDAKYVPKDLLKNKDIKEALKLAKDTANSTLEYVSEYPLKYMKQCGDVDKGKIIPEIYKVMIDSVVKLLNDCSAQYAIEIYTNNIPQLYKSDSLIQKAMIKRLSSEYVSCLNMHVTPTYFDALVPLELKSNPKVAEIRKKVFYARYTENPVEIITGCPSDFMHDEYVNKLLSDWNEGLSAKHKQNAPEAKPTKLAKLAKTAQLQNIGSKLWMEFLEKEPQYYSSVPYDIVNSNESVRARVNYIKSHVQKYIEDYKAACSNPETVNVASVEKSIPTIYQNMPEIKIVREQAWKLWLNKIAQSGSWYDMEQYDTLYHKVPEDMQTLPEFNNALKRNWIKIMTTSPSFALSHPIMDQHIANDPEIKEEIKKMVIRCIAKDKRAYDVIPSEYSYLEEDADVIKILTDAWLAHISGWRHYDHILDAGDIPDRILNNIDVRNAIIKQVGILLKEMVEYGGVWSPYLPDSIEFVLDDPNIAYLNKQLFIAKIEKYPTDSINNIPEKLKKDKDVILAIKSGWVNWLKEHPIDIDMVPKNILDEDMIKSTKSAWMDLLIIQPWRFEEIKCPALIADDDIYNAALRGWVEYIQRDPNGHKMVSNMFKDDPAILEALKNAKKNEAQK